MSTPMHSYKTEKPQNKYKKKKKKKASSQFVYCKVKKKRMAMAFTLYYVLLAKTSFEKKTVPALFGNRVPPSMETAF
jgi:hypothetical protein